MIKSVGEFGIDNEGIEVVIDKERVKGDIVASRGFERDKGIWEGRENRKKGLEAFKG